MLGPTNIKKRGPAGAPGYTGFYSVEGNDRDPTVACLTVPYTAINNSGEDGWPLLTWKESGYLPRDKKAHKANILFYRNTHTAQNCQTAWETSKDDVIVGYSTTSLSDTKTKDLCRPITTVGTKAIGRPQAFSLSYSQP